MVMGKKSKKAADGGARCRRHRRQGPAPPGVCPLCLRERLSRLSLSTSLPSVVVAREEAAAAATNYASASCSDSEASSTEASSTEASSGTSSVSGSASPGFHREMRRAARPSLLMRHERVVAVDGDGVVGVLRRRKERSTSFWTKLLRAATGGGGKKVDGCLLQAHSKTIQAAAETKWILF
ncbi:hypothetical protein ACQ4PT_034967 [Festuca glaucescens]